MFSFLVAGELGVILHLTRRLLRRRMSIGSYLEHMMRPFLRLAHSFVHFLYSVFTLLQIIDMNKRHPPESASRISCVNVYSHTVSLPRWLESGNYNRTTLYTENVVTIVGVRCEYEMRAVTPRNYAWMGVVTLGRGGRARRHRQGHRARRRGGGRRGGR
ncbi:uncharacterized protein H6S33_007926 [Morchella sextelata]|uniref:uncharacterized protein n=1 Tax=Morchella sextelata TaxID=1174677 RepID=UPI001D05799F|nr:uncharacterized protein H6S33_007926 [Morchella sextelata]KAH0602922.1 hypothetical protein H6S33_007926 [Morchella sextelata]